MGGLAAFIQLAKQHCWDFPFSKAQALIDLSELTPIPSVRVLAHRWGWSRASAHRFVRAVKSAIGDGFEPRRETAKPRRIKAVAPTARQVCDASGDANESSQRVLPPRWLAHKAEPLVSYPDPTDPGSVWMTEAEWRQLVQRTGSLECAQHLAQCLENYIGENLGATGQPTKKVQYRDHYRTLLKWYLRKIDEGRSFSRHPQGGWGFWRTA